MLDAWKTADANTLIYEKEALPVGEFAKWTNGDEVQDISIKRGYLDRLVRDFKRFKQVGIRVPLFKTHREDPDNDRGTVEDLVIKPNSKGVESLHLRVKFNTKQARDLGIHNDVSVMCPPKFIDTKKQVYEFPLRHVALTSVPVLPGLDPFTPIILSFDTPSGLMLAKETKSKETKMDILDKILEAMGLTAEEGADDEAKAQLIMGKVKTPKLDLSFPPIMVHQMAQARKSVIDGLVKDEVLSITLGKELETQFCAEDKITGDLCLRR